jgi:hypothetical protein
VGQLPGVPVTGFGPYEQFYMAFTSLVHMRFAIRVHFDADPPSPVKKQNRTDGYTIAEPTSPVPNKQEKVSFLTQLPDRDRGE